MGSELILLDSELVAKAQAKQTMLNIACKAVIGGWTEGRLKRELDQYAETQNGHANYYRISVPQAGTLMAKAKRHLFKVNRETAKETYGKHIARLERLYEAAVDDGNKSMALAITDRLLALAGLDGESVRAREDRASAFHATELKMDAVLGNLSRAIAALLPSEQQAVDSELPIGSQQAVDSEQVDSQ